MKKKLMIGSIFAILMLITLFFVSVVGSETIEKKESPLYKIRTRRAIYRNLGEIYEKIIIKFQGRRFFSLPLNLIKKEYPRYACMTHKGVLEGCGDDPTDLNYESCYPTCRWSEDPVCG
jgi:hypothetical protein